MAGAEEKMKQTIKDEEILIMSRALVFI